MCEETKCDWKCKKPTLCPRPKCELVCEKPACAAKKPQKQNFTQHGCCHCTAANDKASLLQAGEARRPFTVERRDGSHVDDDGRPRVHAVDLTAQPLRCSAGECFRDGQDHRRVRVDDADRLCRTDLGPPSPPHLSVPSLR